MPRYYFNVTKDGQLPDAVGVEMSDIAKAREEAVRLLGEDLKENPKDFWNDEEWEIAVSDPTGLILFTMHCTAMDSPAAPRRR